MVRKPATSEPAAPSAEVASDTFVRLPSAGQSTDPTVHHLIAELGTARSNGDEAAQTRILGRLQTLGYSA